MAHGAVLHNINRISYDSINVPETKDNEVLVKVAAAGICGSDISRVKTKGTYRFPTIPGHEFAGVVEKVGKEVTNFVIGDRVAVYPLIPCGKCTYCKDGKNNL